MNLDDAKTQVAAALARDDQTELARLAAILDAEDQEREQRLGSLGGLIGAALWYAGLGIPVFPLQPRGKQPLPGSHGFKDATTDPGQVEAWWRQTPAANIGAATGHQFDVIDVDGLTGIRSCLALDPDADYHSNAPPGRQITLAQMLDVDEVGHAETPRGGGHHIYIPPQPGRSTGSGEDSDLPAGIDYRGLGGYVAMPPSVGDNGRRYRWTRPLQLEEVT